ncbi:hypothetical protein [Methyloradius palustris]|uniref:Uncharacterized protein n=1 Tax=Methyloradius palustris TaxID=2778876 RepID=A0A8D5G1S6_9PROT|nr:hypothetical protein [Methyloradius palustris]BCM24105.1 hypothetical protein ZMTM_03640 [Methyloradius palustris]
MLKNIKSIVIFFVLACSIFYMFMQLGQYVGKKKLESQYPLVSSLIGEPATWDSKEKELMAYLLPKCKAENESGNTERMKSCWEGRAAAIPDGGNSAKTLNALLDKQLQNKK